MKKSAEFASADNGLSAFGIILNRVDLFIRLGLGHIGKGILRHGVHHILVADVSVYLGGVELLVT